MKMRRRPVSKGRSARKFNKQAPRMKLPNIVQPMRGGIRL
jgi:hypothetical protein